MAVDFIGWVAGCMFALCGAPQALKSIRDGHSAGLSLGFLILWTGGEVLMLIYVIARHGWDGPLLFNYCMNLLFLIVMWKYKIFPRDRSVQEQ